MPELPEVETVCCGLRPAMEGAHIVKAVQNRPNLRFPFPAKFTRRLEGQKIERLYRRAKYIVAELSGGEALIMHLGMSGSFTILSRDTPAALVQKVDAGKHVHAELHVKGGAVSPARIAYADPRRFGFMDLVPSATLGTCRHFAGMGPEPLGNEFNAPVLLAALKGKLSPMKTALLDQRVVAGLGNIYVCEALFMARISPRRQAKSLGAVRAERLAAAIKEILQDAIIAGGSSLRDYTAADGSMGMFQKAFAVYGREGEACIECGRSVGRIVQSGRSTFFCAFCQR